MPSRPSINFHVDTVCQSFIEGWAFSSSGPCTVEVVVDGRVAGTAVLGLSRPDVGAAYPNVAGSDQSGFLFGFSEREFQRSGRDAAVGVRIQAAAAVVESQTIAVPLLPPPGATKVALRSCFPPSVTDVIVRRSPGLAAVDLSSEAGALEGIQVLEHLLQRGPRPLPGVHRYLRYLHSVFESAMFAARHFPKTNRNPTGDKDRFAMLTNPMEVSAIAHHLYVLRESQVSGDVLEFGCYKGYSTSVLSYACQQIGSTLHVFDSFQGLPTSGSGYYQSGEFTGELEEVREHVREFGRVDAVEFHRGFFSDSVPSWPPRPVMCMWMDVDLESSARDALVVFPHLDRRGALFSHECAASTFVDGQPRPERGPDDVVGPIVDAFVAGSRAPRGVFLFGHTAAFWDASSGVAVMPPRAFERIVALARA